MSEGTRSPEQSSRISLKERFSKLIPARFRRSGQPQDLTPQLAEPLKVTAPNLDQPREKRFTPSTSTSEPLQTTKLPLEDAKPEKVTHKELSIETSVEEASEIQPRVIGIATTLKEELKQRNITVPEIETLGVTAIIGTNETSAVDFFETVQAKNPDGYLVGVGGGNAFTLVHGFGVDVIPKGIVLADMDPKAVAVGKMVISGLKNAESAQDFKTRFLGMPEEDFKYSIEHMIASEENPALKERWLKIDAKAWSEVWKQLGEREYITWDEQSEHSEGQNIDTIGAILDKFPVLKQLAMEDNIVMNYADFTDPAYVEAIKGLPSFQESSNVIYFSNIVDHITNRGTLPANAKVLENLEAYEQSSKQPIFIDTLGQKLNYFLRARQSMPKFAEDDFRYIGSQSRSRKPDGLLFADVA